MSAAAIRRIAGHAELPEDVVQHAVEWLVLLWSQEATPEQLDALEQWRAADPSHERAWQHLRALDERLCAIPGSIATGSLRATGTAALSRRRFLLMMTMFGVAGIAAHGAGGTTPLRRQFADLSTTTGEIRTHTLEDGSQVTLNTATAVNVRFDAAMRRLELVTGEVLIETAADPDAATRAGPRPFTVDTAVGSVRPIGTRFTVRHTGPVAEVGVLGGAVRIIPERPGAARIRLDAGGRARFGANRVERLDGERPGADWADGLLVVEQMPLGTLLAELERYRAGVIRCHPQAARLRVSGTFPVDDTDRALSALARALPIRLSTLTRYWITVEPARGAAVP